MSIGGSGTARCGCRATCTSGRIATPGRSATARVTRPSSSCQPAPGVQIVVLIGTDQQEPARAGLALLQLVHRLQRIARARALELAAFQYEAAFAGDRQLHHRLAIAGLADRAGLLPRLAGGNPAHLVQRQRVACAARQRRVRQLRRIEGAAEQPDALDVCTLGAARLPARPGTVSFVARGERALLRAAGRRTHPSHQSRGSRKSVNNRASALPGSGLKS